MILTICSMPGERERIKKRLYDFPNAFYTLCLLPATTICDLLVSYGIERDAFIALVDSVSQSLCPKHQSLTNANRAAWCDRLTALAITLRQRQRVVTRQRQHAATPS